MFSTILTTFMNRFFKKEIMTKIEKKKNNNNIFLVYI